MKKDVWQKTSNEMELQSFQFSWQQCEQKWKNLTKTYRDTIDHNRKSGNDRKECAYFKELQDCYGYRPNVQPVFTLDINTSESQTTAESTNETEKVCSVKEDSNCESTPEVKRKNKSPAASSSNEIMKCLGEIREEQHELIKTIKEQHSDKMKQEDRKLDLMSKIIDALI